MNDFHKINEFIDRLKINEKNQIDEFKKKLEQEFNGQHGNINKNYTNSNNDNSDDDKKHNDINLQNQNNNVYISKNPKKTNQKKKY